MNERPVWSQPDWISLPLVPFDSASSGVDKDTCFSLFTDIRNAMESNIRPTLVSSAWLSTPTSVSPFTPPALWRSTTAGGVTKSRPTSSPLLTALTKTCAPVSIYRSVIEQPNRWINIRNFKASDSGSEQDTSESIPGLFSNPDNLRFKSSKSTVSYWMTPTINEFRPSSDSSSKFGSVSRSLSQAPSEGYFGPASCYSSWS